MIGAYPSNIMKCHLYAEKKRTIPKKKTQLKYFRLTSDDFITIFVSYAIQHEIYEQ